MDKKEKSSESLLREVKIEKVLPFLLDDKSAEIVTPSRFRTEMTLSTEERFKKLKHPLRKVRFYTDSTFPFHVIPDTIIFQNTRRNAVYTLPLTITNKESQSRSLKMIVEESPYFSVTNSSDKYCTKLAPGMCDQFHVNYCSVEHRDARFDITFVTEDMSFVVPIFVLGPRPILDLPDSIKMKSSPVKIENTRTIVVRNLSRVNAIFRASTNLPFKVTPSEYVLNAHKSMILNVTFKAIRIGTYQNYLKITYESGEKIAVLLEATAENENIALETNQVDFDKTYMSLQSYKNVKLYNNSDYVVQYQWKLYPKDTNDQENWNTFVSTFNEIKASECHKTTQLEQHAIIDADGHKEVFERIYEDEIEEYENSNELFVFKSRNFKIIPKFGEIWPKATAEFTLLFSPQNKKLYEEIAYLETTGLDSRLQLKMRGRGKGPLVYCNIQTLDISKIFISTSHTYDIVFHNKGDISAMITYLDLPLTFGGQINCNPPQIKIDAKGFGCFLIELSSTYPGKFVEELKFNIRSSGDIMQFVVTGEVVLPMLGLSSRNLDFGAIGFGFPTKKEQTLINKSKVPIKFRIYCLEDGISDPLTCYDFVKYKATPPRNPKEFIFSQPNGIVPPNENLTLEITLVSNTYRLCTTNLYLEMWDSPDHILTIPTTYNCERANLVLTPDKLLIRGCFITFKYERAFTLKNVSNVMTYFSIYPQNQHDVEKTIICSCSIDNGFLKPNEEIVIKVTLIPLILHEVKVSLFLELFGDECRKACTISCIVQGAVMTIDPTVLNFGVISTLDRVTLPVQIENDAPIPANVEAFLSSKSVFSLDFTCATILPGEAAHFNVSVYVTMSGKYTDTIYFQIENGSCLTCELSCFGKGTCILSEPKLKGVLNLGYILTHTYFKKELKFTNKGKKAHSMLWTRNKGGKNFKKFPIISVFAITPNDFIVDPGETKICYIEGTSSEPGTVEEDFYCFGCFTKSPTKNFIASFIAVAEFAIPVLETSKSNMIFRIDIGTDNTYSFLQDDIYITNRSRFAICVTVSVEKPFHILVGSDNKSLLKAQRFFNEEECLIEMPSQTVVSYTSGSTEGENEVTPGIEEEESTVIYQRFTSLDLEFQYDQELKLTIEFDPTCDAKVCFVATGALKLDYRSHEKCDVVPLRGEVNYPTILFEPNAKIEFGNTVPNKTVDKFVMIRNLSPLLTSYKFEWRNETLVQKVYSACNVTKPEAVLEEEEENALALELQLELPEEEEVNEPENETPSTPCTTSTELLKFYTKKMTNIMYPLVRDFDEVDQDIEMYNVLPTYEEQRIDYDTLNICPNYGTLLPFECQIISLSYASKFSTSIEAICNCLVDGGETRALTITGCCVEICYAINKNVIEFGTQKFDKVGENTFTFTNTGYVRIAFEVTMCEDIKEFNKDILPLDWLGVFPKTGIVQKNNSVKFTVLYYPGLPGEFKKKFVIFLDSGNETIEMQVHGFAIFPQIHLPLLRPDLHKNLLVSYKAIATISGEFLTLLSRSNFVYEEDLTTSTIEKLESHGWDVIRLNETTPSQIDIDMAIERMIAYEHFVININTAPNKKNQFSSIIYPKYEVNLGVITYDILTHYTILLENYCYTKTEYKLALDFASYKKGVHLKSQRTIPPKSVKELNIFFQPCKKDYPSPICISMTFYVQVQNGPKIPVVIRAEISVASLKFSREVVNFGRVRCGDCLRKSIIITNRGGIPCVFTAEVDGPELKKYNPKHRRIFFIKQFEGVIDVNEKILYDIYFEPQYVGTVKWELKLIVESSDGEYAIQVKGYGLEPSLAIVNNLIQFETALPYVENFEKYFIVENLSKIAIECIFSDIDSKIAEEEEIIRTICLYMQTNVLYVPPRKPGNELPRCLEEFYRKILDDLKQKFAAEFMESRSIKSSTLENDYLEVQSTERPEASADYEALIQETIQDVIWSNKFKLDVSPELKNMDPVEEALEMAKPPPSLPQKNEVRDGIVFIFHGSPFSDYIVTANRVGLKMGFPVMNIDQLIYESLAENENLASIKVNEIIDKTFIDIASETDLLAQEDPLDYIEHKVALILSGKQKKKKPKKEKGSSSKGGKSNKSSKSGKTGKSGKSKSKKTKKSKSSKSGKSKKAKAPKDPETFMKLPEELFYEIVKYKIQNFGAIVVESLKSVFLRRPLLALNSILRGVGNVRYIHFYLLSYTFEQCKIYEDNKKRIEEEEDSARLAYRILEILHMDQEEYEALSEEDKLLFKQSILVQRKQQSLERKLALKKRLIERAMQKLMKKRKEKIKKLSSNIIEKKTIETATSVSKVAKTKKGKSNKSGKNKSDKSEKSKKGKSKSSKSKSGKSKSSKSKKSSKGSKKGKKPKLTPEEAENKKNLDAFENVSMNIMHIMEYWNRNKCACMKEYTGVDAKSKKSQKSKKGTKASTSPSLPVSKEAATNDDIGIPLWFYTNVHPTKSVSDILLSNLRYEVTFQNSLSVINGQIETFLVETSELYTVLYKPTDQRKKTASDVFFVEECSQFQIPEISKASITQKEDSKTRSRSKSTASLALKPSSVFDKATFLFYNDSTFDPPCDSTRRILQSGEILYYKVTFKPTTCDNFRYTYGIEMIGWPTKYNLELEASSDIPAIYTGPDVLFQHIIETRKKAHDYEKNCYYKNLSLFDFGPTLITDCVEMVATIQIHLVNKSILPCEINLLMEQTPTLFILGVDYVHIPPNSSIFVDVTAVPVEDGVFNDTLLLAIKNNPRIEQIPMSCRGCFICFNIDPVIIRYNRLVVNATETKNLILNNRSLIPLFWKFMDVGHALKYFKISQLYGYLKPNCSFSIDFKLTPKFVADIEPFLLEIYVYDDQWKCKAPLHKTSVELSAEVITTEVTCTKEVVFGEVKGNLIHTYRYEMLNNGKYAASFKFLLVDKIDPVLSKLFEIHPASGVLQPQRPFVLDIKLNAKKFINIVKCPIFRCILKDNTYNITNEIITVGITVKTHFSKFTVCPPSELQVGYQLINTEKAMTIVLQNEGKFDFTYTMINFKKMMDQKQKDRKKGKGGKKGKGSKKSKSSNKSKSKDKSSKKTKTKSESKKSKKSSKKSKKSSKKSKKSSTPKIKITKLDVGPFTLASSTGVIEPNDTVIINVTSKPKQLGNLEEKILLYVSEAPPPFHKGVIMKLSLNSVLPEIDFVDINNIFKEQLIVDHLSDLICEEQMGNNCLFVKNEQKLYFNKAIINTIATTRLRFYNCGVISTTVMCNLNDGRIFSVLPENISVDPYCTGYFSVSFKPIAIQEYDAVLIVSYDVPANQPKKTLTVQLVGEGYVPEVIIVEPKLDTYKNNYNISFNPTLVNEFCCKTIRFQNIGLMTCKVILEIRMDEEDVFSLIPQEDTIPMLNIWKNYENEFRHTNIVTLKPHKIANFAIKFLPLLEGRYEREIKIHIVNNPFDVFTINLSGDGFCEYVTLNELPTFTNQKVKSHGKETYACYELDFGYICPKTLQKKSFQITNNSPSVTYKFQFNHTNKLIFIPSIGHLKPNAFKIVIATFLTKEPINISKAIVDCAICEIEYEFPQENAVSWDERHNFTIWEPGDGSSMPAVMDTSLLGFEAETMANVKTVKELGEPQHNPKLETLKTIPILLSCVSDYASYECSVHHIFFQETFLFQKSVETFEVKNISNAPFELFWNLLIEEANSKRASSSTLYKRKFDGKTRSVSAMHSRKSFGMEKPQQKPQESPRGSSSRSSISSGDRCYCYQQTDAFQISPNPVVIRPNCSETFTVTFAPVLVLNHKIFLESFVKNLNPASKPIEILIRANSLLPKYHFDLETSDYMKNRRKGKKICGDLAREDVRVVEFEAVGLRIPVVRKFNIVNPTRESFDYNWTPMETIDKDLSLFNCLTPNGTVDGRQLTEAIFSFIPNELGVYEKFYQFVIEKYELSTTFLMAGTARDPCIYFSTPHITLKNTILGIDINDYVQIKNNEEFNLNYRFKKYTTYSEGRQQKLIVDPITGSVPAKSEFTINLMYHPRVIGEITFNLKCEIERMQQCLDLSVTTKCFTVQAVVTFIDKDGTKTILDDRKENIIHCKTLITGQPNDFIFVINNYGETGFYFSWKNSEKFLGDVLNITFKDADGYVKSNTETFSTLRLLPIKGVQAKSVRLKLDVLYGSSYTLKLICSTFQAMFKFSFDEYNFGCCLIQKEKSYYYRTELQFTNNHTVPLLLEALVEDSSHYTLLSRSKEIPIKTVESIKIYFHPLALGQYEFQIPFFVNSKRHVITIRGEAVPLLLDVFDPMDRCLNLTAILSGKSITKRVKIINNSRTTICIIFELYDDLPYFSRAKKCIDPQFEPPEVQKEVKMGVKAKKGDKKKKGGKSSKGSKKSKSSKKSKKSDKKSKASKKSKKSKGSKRSKKTKGSKGKKKDKKQKLAEPQGPEEAETPEMKEKRLIRKFTTIKPKNYTRIHAGHTMEFIIRFAPNERMKLFTEKICYQVQENIDTICVFKGSCIGADFSLDRNQIQFGSVIKGCTMESKIILYNNGDVGGSFHWVFDKMNRDFYTLKPSEGYITPDMSITFTVSFTPNYSINCNYDARVCCHITGTNKPLELLLHGISANMPKAKELIKFNCPVRTSDVKTIKIDNPTIETWKVLLSINNENFYVPHSVAVQPKSTTTCEITYGPRSMTREKPHQAILFLALPHGQGVCYDLTGNATDPLPLGKIIRQIECKANHTEPLQITNWVNLSQRLVVKSNRLPSNKDAKMHYRFLGNKGIDVLSNATRTYLWKIYVLNEGSLNFKIVFENEKTQEYAYYLMELTITKCKPLQTIYLTTCVRKPIEHKLILENPLQTAIALDVTCNSSQLEFEKNVKMEPFSEQDFVIKFNPLIAGESSALLEAKSNDVGIYPYEFTLSGKAPVPEALTEFQTFFGQVFLRKISIANTTKNAANFRVNIGETSVFKVTKIVPAPPLNKGEIEVVFDPNNIGIEQANLKVASETLGEYIFPLFGKCRSPKALGPFTIAPGNFTLIKFRNPFNEMKRFNLKTEPNAFTLDAKNVQVNAKSEYYIKVYMNKNLDAFGNYPITGKLYVVVDDCTCPDLCDMKWIFYLQGNL